jgi:putative restriction endonuclease
MRAYVGVTDWEWYRLLRDLANEEVNFWQPGGRHRFAALRPGEPFLFKLHSPHNFIVGGGIFAHSTILPVSLAWDSFGLGNGARSFDEMRRRIERYRKIQPAPQADYNVGCILLSQPFFLSDADWIPIPTDWSRNIVQGKRYDLRHGPGATLYRRLGHVLSGEASVGKAVMRVADANVEGVDRYGTPTLVAPRLGQGIFRAVVTDAYERRCAITGERVLPVLQAAHIRPFAQEGPHRVQNGLLLRSDLHTLFDRGYVTVAPDLRIEVSRRLHEDFENGRDYYSLRGRELRTPASITSRPAREFLVWHNENAYRG